jgi:cytochrome c553
MAATETGKVDFSFQIRPILADHCFKCHGQDEKARKGKLRLDVPESAYAIRDAARKEAAVVPRHPERSQLCWRIAATNEDDRMPPPASKLSLTSEEKRLLKLWVEQGAEYKPHWAFSPVAETKVPRLADKSHARNAIDAFIQARLARDGIKPAAEASRETLIRRLSFDLRGLPPSLDEIDAFCADTSGDAYEHLVDKLLASPAYGEQQAALWLDLARFADTYGYQNDIDRDMSPWRDWVIRAFNQNLPYDQFITWQIAGDLLPSAMRDQLVATAFNRLHRQTNEGGSIDDEFRAEYVADRVATTGTAFLGLTLGCARCHDHKYDPVSQKNFYRMAAFFNNIDESGLYSHFTRATPSPSLLLYPEGQEAKHKALREQIQSKEAALAAMSESARPRFESWFASGQHVIAAPQPSETAPPVWLMAPFRPRVNLVRRSGSAATTRLCARASELSIGPHHSVSAFGSNRLRNRSERSFSIVRVPGPILAVVATNWF